MGGIFNAVVFLFRAILNFFHENIVFAKILSSIFTIQAFGASRKMDVPKKLDDDTIKLDLKNDFV